jgi:general secretion pathway protein D
VRTITRKSLTGLAVLTTMLAPLPPMPPPVAAQSVRSVVVNLRNVELEQVAEQISRITGRTIVLDPNVGGRVSVVSSGRVSPAGAWELFRSVLRLQGYAAVRSGNVWRIVPQAQAVQSGSAGTANGTARGQEVVTRLIRLQTLPSAEAVRILRPLVASFGSIEASTRPNAVIVTDYAENVRRIERLARSLDGSGGGAVSFQSISLSYANAAEVGESIQRILGDEAAGGPRVAVDERSNMILVRGSRSAIAEARRIAGTLDAPGNVTLTTRVFRLRFSDAEAVAETLRGLLGGERQATNPVARTLADRAGSSAGGTAIGAGSSNRFDGQAAQPIGAASERSAGQADRPQAIGFSTPDLAIQAAPELNAIVVRGSPTAITSLGALIEELDVRRPQVRIEAAIVEITGDAAEQLGIQLGFGSAAALPTSGGTSFSNAGISLRNILSILGAPAAAALPAEGAGINIGSRGDFGVFVQALGQSTKANLLSTPSLTTLDNQPGEIVVGQNVPFRTGSFTVDGNGSNPFTTIEREDVGITLRVVPRVHEGDVVKLEVSQEVSALVNASVVGAADLITNRRSIKTTVLADNGETIVLGGLITDDRLSGRNQVPVLGDIPVIGELFKSRRESRTKRTLFVFLRPTILRDRNDVAGQAGSAYSRIRADELSQEEREKLLTKPPGPKLPLEVDGVYRP